MPRSLAPLWRALLARAERTDPLRLVLLGYLSYVLLGWLALCLPWSHRAPGATALDHLFIATSAVSTTGLATVSVADSYSFFGQLVTLLLIQLGGIGYMTTGSFIVLALSGRLSPLRTRIGAAVFSLPDGLDLKTFLRLLVAFTLAVEAAGAFALHALVFAPRGVPHAWWQSVFHSVSAFCTAGFGLFSDSFESYRGDLWLNLIVIVLSYLGAIGFIVVADAWHALTRRAARVTLTTKIILLSTAGISLVGTVLFFLDEPAIQSLPVGERALAAWFQVMTASTTVGFDTVPIGSLSGSSALLIVLVMIIGASPSGTGGGLKTTTFTALWAVMTSVMRRRGHTVFLGREIPAARVRAAVASATFYCITLAAGTYALALFEKFPLGDLAFECASALGTVGLSRGLTSALTSAGKCVLIALMFVGRVGPLGLGMALYVPRETAATAPAAEDVAV